MKYEEQRIDTGKKCEKCGVSIPQDFNNLLCYACYDIIDAENKKKVQEKETKTAEFGMGIYDIEKPEPAQEKRIHTEGIFYKGENVTTYDSAKPDNSKEIYYEMLEPNVSADVSWLDRGIKRFKDLGTMIPEAQRHIYEHIGAYWCSGRTVLDIGCSLGVGSNILSDGARHVWGYDVNDEALIFAASTFGRSNLEFAKVNIEDKDDPTIVRPHGAFEVVVVSEVLEHLEDYETALQNIKSFFSHKLGTVGFITVPNIANPDVAEADANNTLHLNHWSYGEFYELLTKHFNHVTLYGSENILHWDQDETMKNGDMKNRVIVAKVEGVK